MTSLAIFLVFIAIHSSVKGINVLQEIKPLVEVFNLKTPAFIQSSVSTQRILIKEFSHNDLMVSVVDRSRDVRYAHQDLVMIINDIKELKTEHFQKSGKVLVILNGPSNP